MPLPSTSCSMGPRPVFVDVLSFEPRDPSNPIWLAQGQFVRTFLLPLLAHRHLGWPLSASQIYRDGYEPAQLAEALGPLHRLYPSLLWPDHASGVVGSSPICLTPNPAASPRTRCNAVLNFASAILLKNLRLPGSTGSIMHRPACLSLLVGVNTPALQSHYSAADHARKKEFVERILAGYSAI